MLVQTLENVVVLAGVGNEFLVKVLGPEDFTRGTSQWVVVQRDERDVDNGPFICLF